MTYTNEMVLPRNFAQHSEDEMMYLDGGKFYGINLSKTTCKLLAEGLSVNGAGCGITSYILTLLSFVPGLNIITAGTTLYFAIAGVTLGIGAAWFSKAAKKGGCHIGYDSKKKKFSKGWGTY